MENFLKELNKQQYEAVVYFDSPVLVIAGAGSGKTRVLTYKIAYLISNKFKPSSILALTFTNKAANEMKERINKIIGQDVSKFLWMGTFHSVFARILRYESDNLGFTSDFTIYDTTDSRNLIKTILKELKLDEKTFKTSDVHSIISFSKNNLITPDKLLETYNYQDKQKQSELEKIAEIYKIYNNRCRKANAMDFDDLLINTYILFKNSQNILDKYQSKFQYILVDEYQDTNYVQYLILKELSKKHYNICVVGDDAQSIYSFRGAKIENILNFKNDYPNCKIFKLEQNYRSTQTIVNAANSIIKNNKGQIFKNVWSNNETGEKILITEHETDRDEGFYVANKIIDLIYTYRLKYSDFAILYRTNAQSRIFEETLRIKNIPYRIYGNISFYQRKEIKDALAYLRLIVNTSDDESLKRIINYPSRGIGDVTLEKIENYANSLQKPIWEVLEYQYLVYLGLNKSTINKIIDFKNMISNFQQLSKTTNAKQLAQHVFAESGILKDLYTSHSIEDKSRLENIEGLLNAIGEFVENNPENNQIGRYLQEVSLLTDMDDDKKTDNDVVTVMTVHSAKGLEFDVVFITGMEDNLFPSLSSKYNIQLLEEERRLFYVAVTRARKRVFITYSNNRFKWGKSEKSLPSKFLSEIDLRYIEWNQKNGFIKLKNNNEMFNNNKDVIDNDFIRKKTEKILKSSFNNINNDNTNFIPDNPEHIKEGMIVQHRMFGVGEVIVIEGESENKKARVYFPEIKQEKQLLLKFARLKIIDKKF